MAACATRLVSDRCEHANTKLVMAVIPFLAVSMPTKTRFSVMFLILQKGRFMITEGQLLADMNVTCCKESYPRMRVVTNSDGMRV